MNEDQLRAIILSRLGHSVTVDARELAEAPGWLRTVTILAPRDVCIEYMPVEAYLRHDDEAGLRYSAQYPSLGELIADIEAYLGRPVADWGEVAPDTLRPSREGEPDPEANMRYLERAVRERALPLPGGAAYRQGSIYWRHVELYGEYRPDMLGVEEWDEYLEVPRDD